MKTFLLKHHWKPDWRIFVSAILMFLSFPPWDLWPLVWISMIPWFFAIQRCKTLRDTLIQGLWLSYFSTLGGFYWVAYVLREFANTSWPVSILGLQFFCIVGQPQFILMSLLLGLLNLWHPKNHSSRIFFNSRLFTSLILGLLYVSLDGILPKLFLDTLGHSLYRVQSIRQLAEIGGVLLLTFLIYLANDALYLIWQWIQSRAHFLRLKQNPSSKPRLATQIAPQLFDQIFDQISFPLTSIILPLSLVTTAWIYGHFRYQQIHRLEQTAPTQIHVAAIQGNIGDFDKVAAENGVIEAIHKVMNTYMSMTDTALQLDPRPDFIVWPETAYPSTFNKPSSNTERALDAALVNYTQTLPIPLLFGGYDHIGHQDYNAFFFLAPSLATANMTSKDAHNSLDLSSRLQVYQKNILLLFGEYIPGAESIPFLKEAFPQVGNFGRGSGPKAIEIPLSHPRLASLKIGPIICYEALFANYLAETARKGAQLILNITNDSWFGTWGEPQLHLALTIFRSIETRLPMLRVTNTGISALILPSGDLVDTTDIGVSKIIHTKIPILTPAIQTSMIRFGDWFGGFSIIVSSILLGLEWIRRNKIKIAATPAAVASPQD